MSQIFFRVQNGVSVSHSEYIRMYSKMSKSPENTYSLLLLDPTVKNAFTHLLASAGMALIPPTSEEIAKGFVLNVDSEPLTATELCDMPFFNMAEYLSRFLNIGHSILDLGCGNKALSNQLLYGKVTTVDNFEKFNPDTRWDLNITPLPFADNSFDTVLLIDVIEHLYKDKGAKLLSEAKRISSKYVFVFTPLTWDENIEETLNRDSDYYMNFDNNHRSLWNEKDFEGFKQVYNKGIENSYFGYWEKKS